MRLTILPYPMGKMGFTFIDQPEMTIDCNLCIGGPNGLKFTLWPQALKDFVFDRINDLFKEKFVYPNAKYIRIPGVAAEVNEVEIQQSSSFSEYISTSSSIDLSSTTSLPEIPIPITISQDIEVSATPPPPPNIPIQSEHSERGIRKFLHRKKNSSTKMILEENDESETLSESTPYKTELDEEKKKKKILKRFKKRSKKDLQ